jgi:hypothetical protein
MVIPFLSRKLFNAHCVDVLCIESKNFRTINEHWFDSIVQNAQKIKLIPKGQTSPHRAEHNQK